MLLYAFDMPSINPLCLLRWILNFGIFQNRHTILAVLHNFMIAMHDLFIIHLDQCNTVYCSVLVCVCIAAGVMHEACCIRPKTSRCTHASSNKQIQTSTRAQSQRARMRESETRKFARGRHKQQQMANNSVAAKINVGKLTKMHIKYYFKYRIYKHFRVKL